MGICDTFPVLRTLPIASPRNTKGDPNSTLGVGDASNLSPNYYCQFSSSAILIFADYVTFLRTQEGILHLEFEVDLVVTRSNYNR